MIQKNSTVSVGGIISSGNHSRQIDIEDCSPSELEMFISEMYKKGEVTLKETLVFHPLDLEPIAKELKVDRSEISVKHFSKVWENVSEKRNLYREYKSTLNRMVIDRESRENISLMKDAVKLLESIRNSKSFKSVFTKLY